MGVPESQLLILVVLPPALPLLCPGNEAIELIIRNPEMA